MENQSILDSDYAVAILGGGAAGLSAAIVLARANRKVLVIDTAMQSNRVSHAAHAVFTRDKASPEELYAIAREQLLQYPAATIKYGTAISVQKAEQFTIRLAGGEEIRAKTIVLAQGMEYALPAIPGLTELWGTKAWSCPFCDGYEANGKKLLAILEKDRSAHMQKLLPNWTDDVTYMTPAEVQSVADSPKGVMVTLNDGSTFEVEEINVQVTPTPRDTIAASLGCEKTDSGHLVVNGSGMTTVEGVYAAGDQSSMMAQVNFAVAAGHLAGSSIVMQVPR